MKQRRLYTYRFYAKEPLAVSITESRVLLREESGLVCWLTKVQYLKMDHASMSLIKDIPRIRIPLRTVWGYLWKKEFYFAKKMFLEWIGIPTAATFEVIDGGKK